MSTNPILVEAYQYIRGGQLKAARHNLRAVIKLNPNSERAWLLMSMAVTEPEQKYECLQRVLSLNPAHAEAHRLLAQLPAPTINPQPRSLHTVILTDAPPAPPAELVVAEAPAVAEPVEAVAPEPEVEAPALSVEAGVTEVAPAEAPEPEPEVWEEMPAALPEWLVAQSLVDATLPDIEEVVDEEVEEEEAEATAEAEAEPAPPEISAEAVPSTLAVEAEEPRATTEASPTEEPPAPRAKRRRARRLHTDYLNAHAAQTEEEELPAWLLDEAERTSPARKPSAPTPPVSAPTSTPPPAPAANLEPAPIRVRATVAPTSAPEREPAPQYYSSSMPHENVPGWVTFLFILILSVVVIGVLALLISLIL